MFLDTGKNFSRENDSSGIIDLCPCCGPPRTAYAICKDKQS